MTEAQQIIDALCQCGEPQSKHNAFFWRCSEFRQGPAIDMRKDSAAKRAGENAAATKRARGQDLMPKLHLKGSKARLRKATEDIA